MSRAAGGNTAKMNKIKFLTRIIEKLERTFNLIYLFSRYPTVRRSKQIKLSVFVVREIFQFLFKHCMRRRAIFNVGMVTLCNFNICQLIDLRLNVFDTTTYYNFYRALR